MSTTTSPAATTPPLHTSHLFRRTTFNRTFSVIYATGIITLIHHHLLTLHHSTTLTTTITNTTFLLSDLILAFMWTTTTSFRLYPTNRNVFPENLEKVIPKKDFPAVDIFICTADPYKEPPMNVVNTALSLMGYDYPPENVSVYVSDDGGSELTLFAFFEAAKFAKSWLPFCRDNDIVDRCPEAFFRSNGITYTDSAKIKVWYWPNRLEGELDIEGDIHDIEVDAGFAISLSNEEIALDEASREASSEDDMLDDDNI